MRTPDENAKYMRDYYRRNKDKWPRRTSEQQATYNATRRAKYKEDAAYRESEKAKVKDYRKRKPHVKRAAHLKALYGITLTQFYALLASQYGGCAICERTVDESNPRDRWNVDHDHATGIVRGILCPRCNLALGMFRDDPEKLIRAAEYIVSRRPS